MALHLNHDKLVALEDAAALVADARRRFILR